MKPLPRSTDNAECGRPGRSGRVPVTIPENSACFRQTIRAKNHHPRRRGHLLGAALLLLAVTDALAANPDPPTRPRLASHPQPPFCFEPGPAADGAPGHFLSRGAASSMVITPTTATLWMLQHDAPAPSEAEAASAASVPMVAAAPEARRRSQAAAARGARVSRSVRLTFLGANPAAALSGEDELPGRINYFLGSDPAQWRLAVPTFARVRVTGLYPGVDVVYYGNPRQLEYDFIVAPRADPRAIAFRVEGADAVRVDAAGHLVLALGRDEIIQQRPVLYQLADGGRREIRGGYRLTGARTVAFDVGDYDPDLPLVIDPVLSYSTYLGAAGTDIAWDVAVDGQGNVTVAGETMSAQLPATPGAFSTNYSGGSSVGGDAFVARFDNGASNLVYLTYLGGSGDDAALGLALDAAGNPCLTGFTSSTNFPVVNALRTNLSGAPHPSLGVFPTDAFVTRLDASGAALVYSTYLGGSAEDEGLGIAVDPAGHAYVTGFTLSTNFPVSSNALQSASINWPDLRFGDDAFVTKLTPAGDAFVYSTYLGGESFDQGQGIAADAAGFAYVAGFTSSTNFPLTNAFQTLLNNSTNNPPGSSFNDAFLAKIAPLGEAFAFSTYLGGASSEVAFRLTLDAATNIYLCGFTFSTNFPSASTHLGASVPASSEADAFVAKLDSPGSTVLYAVVFGGTGREEAWDVKVDPRGHAHVVGQTASTNFPTRDPLQATNAGLNDLFVVELNSDATEFVYSTLLGGSGNDFGYALATDPAGNAYVVGQTFSTNFPTAAARQPTFGGGSDAVLAKLGLAPALQAVRSNGDVQLSWPAFAPDFLLESNPDVALPAGWSVVGTPPVLTNGRHTVTLGATNEASFFRLRGP